MIDKVIKKAKSNHKLYKVDADKDVRLETAKKNASSN